MPSQGGGPSQRPRQREPCFHYLEMGHLKANCPKITRQYPLNYISVDKDVDTVYSSVDIVYNSTQGIQSKSVYFPLVCGNSKSADKGNWGEPELAPH